MTEFISHTGEKFTEEELILLSGIIRQAFDSSDYLLHHPELISIAEKLGLCGLSIEMLNDLHESLNDPFNES